MTRCSNVQPPKRSRLRNKTPAPQRCSPFCNLPAELRNMIYELVAESEPRISVRPTHMLYGPSLSLVCQQLRAEYKPVYTAIAPSQAPECTIHITDFNRRQVHHAMSLIPPNPTRIYNLHAHLSNVWTSTDLDSIASGSVLGPQKHTSLFGFDFEGPTKYGLSVSFEPRTIDVDFVRRAFRKIRYEFQMAFLEG